MPAPPSIHRRQCPHPPSRHCPVRAAAHTHHFAMCSASMAPSVRPIFSTANSSGKPAIYARHATHAQATRSYLRSQTNTQSHTHDWQAYLHFREHTYTCTHTHTHGAVWIVCCVYALVHTTRACPAGSRTYGVFTRTCLHFRGLLPVPERLRSHHVTGQFLQQRTPPAPACPALQAKNQRGKKKKTHKDTHQEDTKTRS